MGHALDRGCSFSVLKKGPEIGAAAAWGLVAFSHPLESCCRTLHLCLKDEQLLCSLFAGVHLVAGKIYSTFCYCGGHSLLLSAIAGADIDRS